MTSGDTPEREHSMLDELYPTPLVESSATLRSRRDARTGALDAAIARGQRSLDPQDPIVRDLRQRFGGFGSHVGSARAVSQSTACLVLLVFVFGLSCAVTSNAVLALLLAIGASVVYVLFLQPDPPFFRAVRAVRNRRCPDCNYDLSGLPDAIEIDGLSIGPDRCPECGSPWPLVPPPLVKPPDRSSTLET